MRTMRVPRALFEWLTLGRSIAVILVVGGGFALFAGRQWRQGGLDSMVGVATLAPLVALVLAAPLIALCVGFAGWVDARTWAPWQGIYRAFDDHQIRVVEARDRLWFCSTDVHTALGLTARPAVLKSLRVTEARHDEALGDVLSTAGLVALFGRSTERQVVRLLHWTRHDVERPWRNRREGVGVASVAPDASKAASASRMRPPQT